MKQKLSVSFCTEIGVVQTNSYQSSEKRRTKLECQSNRPMFMMCPNSVD